MAIVVSRAAHAGPGGHAQTLSKPLYARAAHTSAIPIAATANAGREGAHNLPPPTAAARLPPKPSRLEHLPHSSMPRSVHATQVSVLLMHYRLPARYTNSFSMAMAVLLSSARAVHSHRSAGSTKHPIIPRVLKSCWRHGIPAAAQKLQCYAGLWYVSQGQLVSVQSLKTGTAVLAQQRQAPLRRHSDRVVACWSAEPTKEMEKSICCSAAQRFFGSQKNHQWVSGTPRGHPPAAAPSSFLTAGRAKGGCGAAARYLSGTPLQIARSRSLETTVQVLNVCLPWLAAAPGRAAGRLPLLQPLPGCRH